MLTAPPPAAGRLIEGGGDVLLAALAGDLGGEAAGEGPRRRWIGLGGVGAVAEEELDERGVAADGSEDDGGGGDGDAPAASS